MQIGGLNTQNTSYNASTNAQNSFDVHNASLNDVKKKVGEMIQNKKATIKDMLPFLALDLQPLSEAIGKELHVQYYGDLWEHPNKKQDMLQTLKDILAQQRADGAQNAQATKRALTLLEKIDTSEKSSFADILKQKNASL